MQPQRQPFTCPECGRGLAAGCAVFAPDAPDHPGWEFPGDAEWKGVREIIQCRSCRRFIPAHIAERWDGRSHQAARAEWNTVYRGTGKTAPDPLGPIATSEKWKYNIWHGKITVALGHPRNGWVLLAIMTTGYNQHIVIHCSDTYEPFGDLVKWLEAIAEERLPCATTIDEEGAWKRLEVHPGGIEPGDAEFRIVGSCWNPRTKQEEERTYLRCRADRRQLLRAFVSQFARWLDEDYDAIHFGYRNEEDQRAGIGFDLRELRPAITRLASTLA